MSQLLAPYKRLIHDLKGNRQMNNRRIKITAKQQPSNHYNFHVLTANHITTKLANPNEDQRHKYHHLTTTLYLILKMNTAQVVETSVTKQQSF